MDSFFLDEEVEAGESCGPGKGRRKADLPGMCTMGQSSLVLLGIGYQFADHIPVSVLSPPRAFLWVSATGGGLCA